MCSWVGWEWGSGALGGRAGHLCSGPQLPPAEMHTQPTSQLTSRSAKFTPSSLGSLWGLPPGLYPFNPGSSASPDRPWAVAWLCRGGQTQAPLSGAHPLVGDRHRLGVRAVGSRLQLRRFCPRNTGGNENTRPGPHPRPKVVELSSFLKCLGGPRGSRMLSSPPPRIRKHLFTSDSFTLLLLSPYSLAFTSASSMKPFLPFAKDTSI